MTNEEAQKIIANIADQLGEHFDAVQILVSWNEECVTKFAKRGAGNWYARQGMCHAFIQEDIAMDSARAIGQEMRGNDGLEA